MRFDREMPGEGLEIYVHLENGKAILEGQVFLTEEVRDNAAEAECSTENSRFCTGENTSLKEKPCVQLLLFDAKGELVMQCHQYLPQEELCRGILLAPRLWKSISDPYLYHMEAWLLEGKHSVDCIKRVLPLRKLEKISGKGWQLNGEAFELRGVPYFLPPQITAGKSGREQMEKELLLLRHMGANTLWIREGVMDWEFRSLCEQMGFILYYSVKINGEESPKGSFNMRKPILLDGITLPDLYYFFRACWTKEPFIHICIDSLHRQPNGCFEIMVYSNCRKVALYVNGSLFEFQNTPPEFLFREITGQGEQLVLCAEGEGCSVSASIPLSNRAASG